MEKRKIKIIYSAAGGNAGKTSTNSKITLPSSWIKSMGFSETDRSADLIFDGTQIIIRKQISLETFAKQAKTQKHNACWIRYYDKDKLCTLICVDFTTKTLQCENFTEQLIKTAFGANECPTWGDLTAFLEERCISKHRSGLREYLETLLIDEFDPMKIIEKTKGRMAEDEQWIEVEEI